MSSYKIFPCVLLTSPPLQGYVSATDMSSSIGLPESVVEHPREPYRKLSCSKLPSPQCMSPDPHYIPHDDD